MESIIEKIFYKQLGYHETIPANGEYQKANEAYSKVYESLEETLNEDQKEMLSELYLCGGDMEGAAGYMYFKEGFRAGILLGLELLNHEDD